MFKTPILILLFNRPKYLPLLLKKLKKIKPNKIYLHCDGPRIRNNDDKKKIMIIKKIIKRDVNWKCRLVTKFQKRNLGLRQAVIHGIDFFFKNETKGIILEDSILPNDSFFNFCEKLLIRYKNERKISIISGWNPLNNFNIKDSYLFSEMPKIWGWATWRRTWVLFDRDMKSWKHLDKDNWFKNSLKKNYFFSYYWKKVFNDTYKKKNFTWDYNLVYTVWKYKSFCIIPNKNLIFNQDYFDDEITTHKNNFKFDYNTSNIKFPLIHPKKIKVNVNYDTHYYRKYYGFKFFFIKDSI
jgi:hypothetical protein